MNASRLPATERFLCSRAKAALATTLLAFALPVPAQQTAASGASAAPASSAAPTAPSALPRTSPADPNKVLRTVFVVAETGFDPAAVHDLYSGKIVQAVFETLLTYDYLANPVQLAPKSAEALPEITDGGKTWTFKIKKGIYFADDPAFGGKPRELTAADYAYSLKRLMDPKIRSPWGFLLEGKVVGLDALAERAKKSGSFDYDARVPGIETPDRYTLRLKLNAPDYNMGYVLAHEPTSAMAREVVEKYRDKDTGRVMANPVGTGPYILKEWVRASKMVLVANPNYRGVEWKTSSTDPKDQDIIARMKGKRLPQIGRIEVQVMEEDQSRLLAFKKGEIDQFQLEGPLAPQVLDKGELKPEYKAIGAQLSRITDPEITYLFFNHRDPLVGGDKKEQVALRRAVFMAHDVQEEIRVVRNGEAQQNSYPIPLGVVGHDPHYKTVLGYDPKTANALLDAVGYKKGSDGFRTQPNGQPLVLTFSTRNDSLGRQQEEAVKKTLDRLSIRMESKRMPFPDLLKGYKQCEIQFSPAAWIADYPDGDNFVQLLYGPNVKQSNNGCFANPEYDKRYKQSQLLPDGPERNQLYREMARLGEVYGAWKIMYSRYRNIISHKNVIGYRKHPILHQEWLYTDLDGKPSANAIKN